MLSALPSECTLLQPCIHCNNSYFFCFCSFVLQLLALLSHWQQVWTLCKALWGGLTEASEEDNFEQEGSGSYKQQLERRQSFSAWLSCAAETRICQELSVATHSPTEAIFSYLTGYKISQACKLAQQSGLLIF